jgi:Ran GTPase-activating protein (RanGAP) involved in mRNA processing and transport
MASANVTGALATPWLDDAGAPLPPLATLDLRGPRGALSGEAAARLVAHVVEAPPDDGNGAGDGGGGAAISAATAYERLVLSTWALGEDSARELARAVARLPRLRSAVLADIIAGRPEAEGLAVYRALAAALTGGGRAARLEELDLSDNAVGTKGVAALRPLLEQVPNLRRLFFCNCGVSAEAARSIADCLLGLGREGTDTAPAAASASAAAATTTTATATALRLLHFDNNMSGGAGAVAVAAIVASSPELRDLRFSSSRGAREGGEALARALAGTPRLQRLDLHDNLFAEPLGVALGAALAGGRLAALTHLDVSDVLLRDAGAAALAAGLVRGCAPALRMLDVSVNELTAEGGRALARCARRLARLRVLRAGENELGDEGALAMARALGRRAHFRRRLGAREAQQKLEQGEGEGEEEEPLEELDLSEVMLSDAGAVALAPACAAARAPRLRRLGLGGNDDVTARGLRRVRALLPAGVDLGDVEEPEEDEEGREGGEGEEVAAEGADGGEVAGDDDADSDLDQGPSPPGAVSADDDALLSAMASAKI